MEDVAGPAYPQQNRRDQLTELFPEYDIDLILESLPQHSSAEHVANWILTNSHNAPRKRKAQKRKTERQLSSDEEEFLSDEDEVIEGLVLNKLLKELYSKYAVNDEHRVLQQNLRSLIGSIFPKIRMEFINKVFSHNKNVCSTMIACWFVSNKCIQKLRDFMNNPENIMWVTTDPLHGKRKHIPLDEQTDEYLNMVDPTGGIIRFKEIMQTLSNRYPEILKGTTLLNKAFTLKIEIPEGIEMFECGVCFTEKSIDKRIMCGNTESEVRHSFCRTCLRGHASAAAEDMPLAEGAVGLKCMEFKCMNPIYYSAIRSLIPKEIRQRIDNRILEENLGLSGLNLERCRDCNYAIEMEETKEQNKVFDCQNCEKQWCRLCHREWNEDHFGISCEELDEKNNIDRKKRKMEEKLNEVLVRICGKCGLQMIKQDGCNKMTCRCGATMCYVCRKLNINYDHFCRHVRTPGVNKCEICPGDTCTLWEDAQKRDNEEMERIRREEGFLVDLPKSPERERMEARNRREEHINQVFQNNYGNNDERQGNNNAGLLHTFGNPPLHEPAPRINLQMRLPQNFDRNHQFLPNRPVQVMGTYAQQQLLPLPLPLHPRINQGFFQGQENRNFNYGYGGNGNLNNGPPNFERRRIQQEINRVNGVGDNNGGINFMQYPNLPFAENQNMMNAGQGNEMPDQNRILNELLQIQQNVAQNQARNQVNQVRDDQYVNGNMVGNPHMNNMVEQREERNENIGIIDPSDSEIEITDDDDELIVLPRDNPLNRRQESPIRRPPERTAIQLAVDRLSDGAPAYELVPLGIDNFERSFNELANDCNAVADFAANDCNQAADLFMRNFVMNHPEHEEEAEVFRQFANEQNRFAELARLHRTNNEALLMRLQEMKRNRDQQNNQGNAQEVPNADDQQDQFPQQVPNADGQQYQFPQQVLDADGQQYQFPQQVLDADGQQYQFPQQVLNADDQRYQFPQQVPNEFNQNNIPGVALVNGNNNSSDSGRNQHLPQNTGNPGEINIQDNYEVRNPINIF